MITAFGYVQLVLHLLIKITGLIFQFHYYENGKQIMS